MRTQIYLEPSQHAALVKESRRLGLSLAGIIRKLIEDHILGKAEGAPSRLEQKKAALSLISLGKSGVRDISEKVDEYLGQAILADMVKEKPMPYKASANKKKARPRK